MDDMLESYELETVEQIRAVSDELCMRSIKQLALQAMTVTQLAVVLDEAANRLHYHVRELERVGLLHRVETREKGAILEKYYRTVARNMTLPKTLLSSLAPDEALSMLNEVTRPFFQGIARAAEQMMRLAPQDQPEHVFQFRPDSYWMTTEEFAHISQQMQELLRPYERMRGIDGEHELTVLWAAYATAFAGAGQESTADALSQPGSAARCARRGLTVNVGMTIFTRKNLEEYLARGEVRAIYVLGICTFADDIPSELVERVVSGFHHRGKLNASPAVREVLKRKGSEVSKGRGNSQR